MSSNEGQVEEKVPGLWNPMSARCRLTFLVTCVVLANSFIRNSLSVAMVCMVNSTSTGQKYDNRSAADRINDRKDYGEGEMNWSAEQQGLIFSSMYFGGLITGLPAGIYADRFNPKMIITACLFLNMGGSLLTPIIAKYADFAGVFALRFLMGLGGQATIYPCIAAISAKWIPPNERGTVVAFYSAGSQMASVIGMPLNAYLCSEKDFLGGWPAIFYVNGLLVFPILVLWLCDSTNNPDTCTTIGQIERRHIYVTLASQTIPSQATRIPYKKILTSKPVIVTLISHFALFSFNTVMISYMPTYLKDAFDLDLRTNGVYSSLPFLSQGMGKIFFGILADCFISRKIFGPTCLRKSFNTFGAFAAGGFLLATAYSSPYSVTMPIIFLTLCSGLISLQVPGHMTCVVSIAPTFSGTVAGLARYSAQIAATISPLIVGAIVTQGTSEQWRIIFLIITGLLLFSALLFLIFGSAEIQEWAKPANLPDASPLIIDPAELEESSQSNVVIIG